MSLYLVTGNSGTGKSTLTHIFRERGYAAYDTDDDALARWQHNITGYIHPKSSVKAHQRTPEFLAAHSWNVPRSVIESLDEPNKPVFVLGAMSNELQVVDLFAGVVALYIDDATMTHRLHTRTNNNWGKQDHELAQSVAQHQGALERYQQLGYIVIDAAQPSDLVADEIEQHLAIDGK